MLGAVFLGLLFVEQCEEFVEGQLVEGIDRQPGLGHLQRVGVEAAAVADLAGV